jgi:membrane fusion protein, multidrug efflux system
LAYAQSQVKVARASLQHTLALMQYTRITAPFAGQIALRSIDPGDFVTSAAASKAESLFSLNSIGRCRIVFDVPESSATKIQIGQPIELKVDSLVGESFAGTVMRTTGQLDRRTRTLRVEAELDPPQALTRVGTGQASTQPAGIDRMNLLRPGMFGMITLTPSASYIAHPRRLTSQRGANDDG